MKLRTRGAMGISGIERLRQAADRLSSSSSGRADGRTSWNRRDDLSQALLCAASEVWSAMFEMPSWPTELRMKAVALQSSLFRYGTIRMSIEQMVEPERLQLERELLAFIETAETIHSQSDPRSDEQDGHTSGDGRALSNGHAQQTGTDGIPYSQDGYGTVSFESRPR